MRALRIATLFLVVLSLLGGATVVAVASTIEPADPIRQVSGTLDVHRLPGGTFDIEDRVFQYRNYPVAGSSHHVSDPRLSGYLLSDWNWDVQASGDRPVPAWGTITIAADDGNWEGSFTGIRVNDFKPVRSVCNAGHLGGRTGRCRHLGPRRHRPPGRDGGLIPIPPRICGSRPLRRT